MNRVKIVCVRRASDTIEIYDQDTIINGFFHAHCKNLGALTISSASPQKTRHFFTILLLVHVYVLSGQFPIGAADILHGNYVLNDRSIQ